MEGLARSTTNDNTTVTPSELAIESLGIKDGTAATSTTTELKGSDWIKVKSPPKTGMQRQTNQLQPNRDTDSVTSSVSDVETFNGKIVYNPDGSAYIIEGPESEGSDVEAEISQEGSIIDARGMTPPYDRNIVVPQIVSAFHISRSSAAALYNALYGQAYQNLLQENKVPEVPIMHSYRVFTLRDEHSSAGGQNDATKLLDEDNNNLKNSCGDNAAAATSASSCTTVPVKPILMCFICKLSFGYAKSFVAHAMGEHNISLNSDEKRVLSHKNTSAIIQVVGKDKEPLLSFLEPRQRGSPVCSSSELQAQMQHQLEAQQRLLAAAQAAAAAAIRSSCPSSLSISTTIGPVPGSNTTPNTAGCNTSAASGTGTATGLATGTTGTSANMTAVSPAITSPVTSTLDIKQCESHSSVFNLPKNGDDHDNNITTGSRATPDQDNSFAPELADLANLEKIAKAAAAAVQQQQVDHQSSQTPTSTLIHQQNHQRSPSPSKNVQPSTSPKSPLSTVLQQPLVQQQSSPSPNSQQALGSVTTTNNSPFVCSQHPDGKTNGVECPKCDLILGSSRSLGGHMTMMHSRNSCKTLKCPKCNWHYKYQETLEIHMKEKHPENEMNCIYCLANQPHPRLARGETYTCGYKPYRCEVCNYSTTTKGNLSIHMQSDKHINNVQELQNGNIPAEHLLQSQALAVAAVAAASSNQSNNNVPTTTPSNATSPSPVAGPIPIPQEPKTNKPQQVTNNQTVGSSQSKPKATWRCDICNYETNVARNLRIHNTSEKHGHNMMVLQQNVNQMKQLTALQQAGMLTPEQLFAFHPGLFAAAAGLNPGQAGPGDNLQPEAANIADIAYNHALLMMASQQNQQRAMVAAMMQQQQQQQQQQQNQQSASAAKSLVAGGLGGVGMPTVDLEHPDPSLRLNDVPYDDTCRLFQCCVCGIFSSDSIEGLSQHIQCDRTRQREDEVLAAAGGKYICKLCNYTTNLKANFQLHCKTDKHLQRLQHVNHIKEGGTRAEWKLKYVNVSNPVQVRCNVCDYYTNSIHKLQLHTANPRHDACSRVFLHLQLAETMVKSDIKYYYCSLCQHPARTKISLVQHINSIKHLRNENLRQLKQQAGSIPPMRDAEEEIREMFQVKELNGNDKINFENETNSSDEVSGSPPSTAAIESVGESMLKNALMEQALTGQMTSKINSESASNEQTHSCPYCYYTSCSEVRIQMHIASQHSKKQQQQQIRRNSATPPTPTASTATAGQLLCPLCQEAFKERVKLEAHLIDVHNVTKEGVQRLMLLVDATDLLTTTKQSQANQQQQHSPSWSANEDSLDSKCEQRETIMDVDGRSDCSGDSGSKLCDDELIESMTVDESLHCPGCSKVFLNVDELFIHINEQGHLKPTDSSSVTTPRSQASANSGAVGYQCWKKGCGQSFKTITATQLHFKEQHAFKMGKISGAAVSDRHVYKYRCSQCSLAFKTFEKLQLHSQYHLIRAATQCVLCGRSFRSVEALQKHVESTHSDMSEEEVEQYRASLINNPLLLSGRNGGGILDPSTTELLKKESNRLDEIGNDDEAMDLALSNTNAATINDDVLDDEMNAELGDGRDGNGSLSGNQQTNSLEDYLNSQAVAEDGYNDPNRKYKCHRCKVAFTRQSYLTSHNKTLLHRKGEKLSYPMEKYLDPNRPYKCDICKESFTQKNILLVHYNSVSHLHKLKQTMKENSAVGTLTTSTSSTAAANNNNTSTLSASPSGEGASPGNNSTNKSNLASDLDKKPYRCNVCKVAYNIGTTLDIHIRSVAHQTRYSKLHELALSGQIDLNLPMIERPDNASELLTLPTVSGGQTITGNTQAKLTAGNSDKPLTPSPSTTPKQFQENMTLNLAEQQQVAMLQQAALNLAMAGGANNQHMLLGTSPFTCQRCGAAFMSQEAQIQHQQLCCLFGPPNNNPNLNTFNNKSCQQQTTNQKVSQSPQPNEQQLNTQAHLRPPKFSSYAPVCRSKPPLYKHLLETWGFEIVMQFNECHQKRVKKEGNNQSQNEIKKDSENPATSESKEVINSNENNENQKQDCDGAKENSKVNLPEINRSKCGICSKEFSSVWVLKAHREEIHKDVVPLDVVEQFADDFRNEYERKCSEEDHSGSSPDHIALSSQEPNQVTASGGHQSNTPPPAMSMANSLMTGNSNASQADVAAANQMAAAHLQFSQLLMSMGLAGMGMPMGMNVPFAAMGLHPPLIPVMMTPHLDPMMAAAFNNQAAAAAMVTPAAGPSNVAPAALGSDPNFFAAQQKLLQQQQQQLAAAQQQKRARTRISDEQLKVLRQYFDINNSPTEEQLMEMSEKSGLPMKVIKHWFRNTLFKERQRNKDSPYNFNNPPSTFLNLEEYEKTGEAKMLSINEIEQQKKSEEENKDSMANDLEGDKCPGNNNVPDMKSSSSTKESDYTTSDDDTEVKKKEIQIKTEDSKIINETQQSVQKQLQQQVQQIQSHLQQQQLHQQQAEFDMSKVMLNTSSPQTSESSLSSHSADTTAASLFAGLPGFAAALPPPLGTGPLQLALDAAHRSQVAAAAAAAVSSANSTPTTTNSNSNGGSSSGKRANRTRFTDYQIKVLQEFFESNAYPKDDDLEYLSKLLNLSPRVIVVWFQNARQKARKVYENQPAAPPEDDGSGRFQRTPGLNYQCKKCMQVFQRYYELIKHQKSSCFKDENPLAAQIKAAAESRAQSTSPGVSREAPATTPTPVDSGRTSATPDKQQPGAQTNVYRCDKCSLVFARFDLWREHQLVHLMNPNLFPNYPPTSPFGILQYEAQQTSPQTTTHTSQSPSSVTTPVSSAPQQQGIKRKLPEDEDSHDYESPTGTGNNNEQQTRDKRLRTTILPEQLDYLYQKYQIESNPSRKMLESIAKDVGLKKRVVQVWFQNTRARERKGQFRAHQQVIHKRCPFCRALFKARSALESHLATRHADQYTKGDINIDALPDGDPNELNDASSPTGGVEDFTKNLNAAGLSNEALHSTMKRYYEDSLKKYLDELNLPGKDGTVAAGLTMKAAFGSAGLTGDTPLDLSKPVDLSRQLRFSTNDDEGFDDTRSEGDDSDSSDNLELEYDMLSHESNPTSPAPGSTTSSTASAFKTGNSGPSGSSNSNKRFRTQMTTVQLKVMKSVFADYKTPSMAECECLGREIGLPKRVVQVWFQNARAKEKKAKLAFAKTFGQDLDANAKTPEECKICNVKYNLKFSSTSMQDHLFSKKHIENLKQHIDNVKKLIEGQEDNSSDFPIASGLIPPGTSVGNATSANNLDDSNDNRSKSGANLMQQLQLMGLAGALQPGLNLAEISMNGGNIKTESEQQSLTPKSSPDKSPSSGTNKDSASDADNMFPFNMYSNLQGYYAAAGAAAFLHPSMYNQPTASSGTGSAMPTTPVNNAVQQNHFPQQQQQQQQTHQQQQQQQQPQSANSLLYSDTSNMYGTPLSLLQLPSSALSEITAKLNQPGISSVRFMQDGHQVDELRCVLNEADLSVMAESDVEVGFTCKKCHMTYPAEVLCLGHQRASCFAKQNTEIKATLKLVQVYIECRECHEKFASIVDYKFHCQCERHLKRLRKYQVTTNGGAVANQTNNNVNDVASLFMNGNEANLLNYLTKNMNIAVAAYNSNSSGDARHCQQ